jgi:hypothetical protein
MTLRRPKSRATKWREARVALGICGYCGKAPICRERSNCRCAGCLDANEVATAKYRLENYPQIVRG